MLIELKPVAWVKNARPEIRDDFWGGMTSEIILDDTMPTEAVQGLDEFSHIELVFHFHQADPTKIVVGVKHPRDNPDYPEVGIFARRGKHRPNRIGLTIARLVEVRDRTIVVDDLDAINGTPILDIKPVMKDFMPKDPIRQPDWADDIMAHYWATGKAVK